MPENADYSNLLLPALLALGRRTLILIKSLSLPERKTIIQGLYQRIMPILPAKDRLLIVESGSIPEFLAKLSAPKAVSTADSPFMTEMSLESWPHSRTPNYDRDDEVNYERAPPGRPSPLAPPPTEERTILLLTDVAGVSLGTEFVCHIDELFQAFPLALAVTSSELVPYAYTQLFDACVDIRDLGIDGLPHPVLANTFMNDTSVLEQCVSVNLFHHYLSFVYTGLAIPRYRYGCEGALKYLLGRYYIHPGLMQEVVNFVATLSSTVFRYNLTTAPPDTSACGLRAETVDVPKNYSSECLPVNMHVAHKALEFAKKLQLFCDMYDTVLRVCAVERQKASAGEPAVDGSADDAVAVTDNVSLSGSRNAYTTKALSAYTKTSKKGSRRNKNLRYAFDLHEVFVSSNRFMQYSSSLEAQTLAELTKNEQRDTSKAHRFDFRNPTFHVDKACIKAAVLLCVTHHVAPVPLTSIDSNSGLHRALADHVLLDEVSFIVAEVFDHHFKWFP